MEDKKTLRKHYLSLRAGLPEKERLSRLIYEKVINTDAFRKARTIGFYFSDGMEPDLSVAANTALALDKTVCFPKVLPDGIHFYRIRDLSSFSRGAFGLMEPAGEEEVREIDLLLVPGVAFDYHCGRLGHGKGYYDCFLSRHPGITTIGISFDCTLLEGDVLPSSETDVKMDFVLSESCFYCNPETCPEQTTLCYLERGDEYLLLYRNKKKNDLNGGKYIGIGGHLEKGETKEQAMRREILEETGLTVGEHLFRGTVYFSDDSYCEIMYLFTSSDFSGTLSECDEGELRWVKKSDMLTLPHWKGDEDFLRLIQENSPYFELSLQYSHGELVKSKKLA